MSVEANTAFCSSCRGWWVPTVVAADGVRRYAVHYVPTGYRVAPLAYRGVECVNSNREVPK